MLRAELGALREGQVLTPVQLTLAEASALNRSALVNVTPEGDGWRVTAAYAVGVVRCGDLVVRVHPKVGVLKVLELLARARGIRNFAVDPSRVELAAYAELSTVLAVLFALEAQQAMGSGPLRGYRTEEQSLPVLRGRLRMAEQYLRRHGAVSPLEVTVDEWTLDTDENRRLRAAGRALLGLAEVPARTRVGLLRLDRQLTEVATATRGAPLAPWTPTRLNVRLHALLHLADLVLAHSSVEHGPGGTTTRGFVINMATLFENLVGQLLGEAAPGLVTQQSLPLDTLGRLTIRPDLVFHAAGCAVAVADTKYKLLDENGKVPNADAYQLVAYCSRLGLRTGHLIYAAGQPHSEPYDIVGTDVRLVIHSIDLSRTVAEIEAQLTQVLGLIVAVDAVELEGSVGDTR